MYSLRTAAAFAILALGAPIAHGQLLTEVQPSASAGPTWDQFNQTVQRLEAEIRELKEQRIQISEQTDGLAPSSENPAATDAVQPVGYEATCLRQACTNCSSNCADCGKQICEGLPHVCGICLEKLSWNKAGGWKIVPFGMLRGEMIYAQQEQAADAVIFFLGPENPGVDDDQFTAHAKTSMLNFAFTGPNIGSWQTGGAIVMNFTGSQPLRNTSGPQVLNAYGEVKNDDWRFAFGRMFDLFSPITPSTVNMGQQRGAGNVGIYRGAMQLDRYINLSTDTRWTLSGRLSQPVVNDFLLLPTARGQDNGIPNFEGRIGLELGPERDGHRTMEIGISGLWGETLAFDPAFLFDAGGETVLAPPAQNVSTTAGGSIDFQLHGERFGFRSEFWAAQAAGTYFVAVLQTLNPATGDGIRSIGGWGEVYGRLNDCTTCYLGYGIDDPRNQDLGFLTDPVDPEDPGQRTFNQVAWATMLWDITDFFQLGFEVSHRKTDYVNPFASSQGMLYHFASSLKY